MPPPIGLQGCVFESDCRATTCDCACDCLSPKPLPHFSQATPSQFRDSLPHVRVKEWRTEEDVVNVLGNITDYITKIITKPVLPALGNHDYWPGNQLPGTDGDPLYRKIAEIWKPFLEPIGAMESFMRGRRS